VLKRLGYLFVGALLVVGLYRHYLPQGSDVERPAAKASAEVAAPGEEAGRERSVSVTAPGPVKPVYSGYQANDGWGRDSGYRSRTREQRIAAIERLYTLNRLDAIPRLSAILADEPDSEARMAALLALDAIDGEAAVEALATGLADPAPTVRQQVIESLWSRGTQTSWLLGQVVFGDSDPRLRLRAIELLASDGGSAAKVLVEAALEDEDPQVSDAAGVLLSAWVAREAQDPDSTGVVQPVAGADASLLESPDPLDRILAVRTLHEERGDVAIAELGRVLVSDHDPEVRMEAVGALAGVVGDEAVTAMAGGLGDREPAVRSQVLERLWERGSGTIPLIGQVLLGDSEPRMRARAAELLAADASPAALALLESAATDPDEEVRAIVARKLGGAP
jgi:HEAT repeat protein